MNSDFFKILGRFLLLIPLQVLIANHMRIFGYINPQICLLFVIWYPLRKDITGLLLNTFLFGILLDIFSNSGGVNTAALLFISYVRLPIIKFIFNDKDLNSALTDLISKIGENIQIISYKKYHSENSIFINYLHNKYNSSCSKIASVVEISTSDTKKASEISDELKVVAMQVSAMKPMGLNEESIDPKILEDEKDIILKQIENTPDDKKEQIVKGKLNKFIKENTLMGQALITDPKNTVANYVADLSKSNNLDLNITSMDLYTI